MRFEYDPDKSQGNSSKHGIDFEEAKLLWQDAYRIKLQANSTVEPRSLIVGKIADKHWSAIVTYRDGANQNNISATIARK